MALSLRAREECKFDFLSLGEIMLRFDPGEERIVQTRHFRVWEAGGEYNVARALRRVFGYKTAVVTALVDNPVGRLVEDLMLQGGVNLDHIVWREYDSIGKASRNGIYFMERGFGLRNALGSMDRGHTAISQLRAGDVDWDSIFSQGVRWFHSGGIMCALSEESPALVKEAMISARKHGVLVSFDCNYRPSLWKAAGGRARAAEVNRELAPYIDVLFGHEGDIALELGAYSYAPPAHTYESYAAMCERIIQQHPNFKAIATTTRTPHTASVNDFGAFGWMDGEVFEGRELKGLDIFDRVGGGDGFASGVVCGLMEGRGMEWSLNAGLAHGALVMTTAGDNSFATRAEVERVMQGGSRGADR